mgnify:CR=1 FL=1
MFTSHVSYITVSQSSPKCQIYQCLQAILSLFANAYITGGILQFELKTQTWLTLGLLNFPILYIPPLLELKHSTSHQLQFSDLSSC